MKIEHVLNETTTAGSVSSVAMPLGKTVKRTTENVKGLIPAEKVLKAKKKGPYANSLSEGKDKKSVVEDGLQEDELIIIPGQSKRLKAGFIPKAQDRTDHEVEMAKADLLALYKNTKSVLMCIKDINENEGLEGWVQEKIIKASDYMNTLAEYFEGKKIQEMSGGVIAAGGVGEGVAEGASKEEMAKIRAKHDKMDEDKGTAVPWQVVMNALASGYPDLDPTDSLRPIMRKYGVEFDDLNLLAKQNGYNDIYAVLDEFGQDQGVAEGSLNEGQYEMMMRNGQVKKFFAKDDADAKRIAAGHGAKSVIRLKGGVPAGKVSEQGVAEGLEDDFAKLTDKFAQARGIKFKSRELGPRQPTTINEPTKASFDNAALTSRLKELEAEFDPQFQYSDDYGFWLQQKRIQDEIYDIKKQLAQQDIAESQLNEKAKSAAQQKFFGMAHAIQKGKKMPGASEELKDVAKSMKKSDVKDFAKTKHKGLPTHVKKEK